MGNIKPPKLTLGNPMPLRGCMGPAAEGAPVAPKPLALCTIAAINANTWWQTVLQQMLSSLALYEMSHSNIKIRTIQTVNPATLPLTLTSNQEILRAKYLQGVLLRNIVMFGKNAQIKG